MHGHICTGQRRTTAAAAAMATSDGRDYFQRARLFWMVTVSVALIYFAVSSLNHLYFGTTEILLPSAFFLLFVTARGARSCVAQYVLRVILIF